MKNETQACPRCHLVATPSHLCVLYKEVLFHTACLETLRAVADYEGRPMEIAHWKDREKLVITIDPQVSAIPVQHHQVRFADEFDVAAGSR